MKYTRKQYHTLKERIEEPRRFIQVLAGPRQVGKSTLVEQVLKSLTIPHSIEVADAVEPNDNDWIRRVWESARTTMTLRGEAEYLLVIDEIQKIDNWSEVVKREWDVDARKGRNLKVVLLGSSRLLLKKGLTESLAGRFELIRLGHWSYQEMHDAFGVTLDEYIYFGGYPGAVHLISDEKRWRKYIKDSLVTPAIEKDVLMTSNIYKPALMKQLFELGCGYSAEILSLTKLMGQLQDAGNVTTLASYLEILNQCALLTGLQKFANDDARKRASIPKYQVYNNALMTAYKGRSFINDRTDPMLWGRWVESAVGTHLLGIAEEEDYQVYYWRDTAKNRQDMEVDFIIVNDGEVTAIEVKSGRRGMNSGLPAFVEAFHPKKSFVVGSGGVSLEDFLKSDIANLLR
ncbi:AAA family ATPase [Porphyromonas sp. HMSC077F02]|uniref:ATP-binding protein n=1 Tax=Porphyromonas sp. HMSC077F02 TaxID=1739529 RepID=UPI0008A1CCAB|nr:AAA family ATPase [Porphyromonas sp. HMSC077F02]OFO56031.1 AAA family ATPase [Porphyromonas sp. HMSC077F02]